MTNPAMEAALKSIEMTFSPERKVINDKVLAMTRVVSMMENPRFAERAFSIVEEYGISDKYDLKNALVEMREAEQEFEDHEFIRGADTNIRNIDRAVTKLSSL